MMSALAIGIREARLFAEATLAAKDAEIAALRTEDQVVHGHLLAARARAEKLEAERDALIRDAANGVEEVVDLQIEKARLRAALEEIEIYGCGCDEVGEARCPACIAHEALAKEKP